MSDSTADNPPTWPERGVMCLECRTTYPAGTTACEAGSKHRVADVSTSHGQEALRTEVWGPASRRRKAREAARAGGTGAVGGSAAEGCGSGCAEMGNCGDISGCDAGSGGGEVLGALLVIAVAIIAAIAIYFVIKALVRWYRRRKARLKPRGALDRAPSVGRRSGRVGVIEDGDTAPAPVTGTAAVAFGMVAKLKRHLGGKVTLRDATSIGFHVLLDDGERVRVPAGPVFIDMRGADDISSSANGAAMGAYFASVQGAKLLSEHDMPPIPYDRLEQRVLTPGMRVEIRGPMRLAPDAGAHSGGYRDAAGSVYVPEGTPRLALAKDD